jgi:hypothetical protein
VFTIGRAKKVLGISVGERGALVADVSWTGQAAQVGKVAQFSNPAGVTGEQPEALGAALGAFLRENGIHTKQAVIGVPAKWLLSKAQSLPPADEETAASMLSLRAEAEAAPELGEMAFDYAGHSSAVAATSVLLLGLPRRAIDRVRGVAAAAGLDVIGLSPCGIALSEVNGGSGKLSGELVLSVRPEASELVGRDGGQVRFLRYLGPGLSAPAIVSELRRAATIFPAGSEPQVTLWDDVGLEPSFVDEIRTALGLPVVRAELRSLAGAAPPLSAIPKTGASPVALALPLLSGVRPAVDFLHPRLVRPRTTNVRRRIAWAAGAVVAFVALAAYLDLSSIQRRITHAESDIKDITPALSTAKPFVSTMGFAETYKDAKPRYLACLRDITQAVSEDGQTYLTSLHLDANLKGDFAGRSVSNQEIINLMDRLNASGRFSELKRKLDGRGNGPEVIFSVTFKYRPGN